jgi:hypothetical protein
MVDFMSPLKISEIPASGYLTNFLEVEVNDDGTIRAVMNDDTIALLKFLEEKGIKSEVRIEFCG